MQTVSEAAAYTLQFINQTQRSVFLTGKAGTGKTTLLKKSSQLPIRILVVASTGIAALNRWCHDSLYVSIAVWGFIPAFGVDLNSLIP
jgi:hypothetical protein